MQFLKTLFWVILAVVLVLFAHANWTVVPLNLWGGLQADVKLPVLVLGAFLLGFVPTLLIYRTRLWALRRRQDTQSQAHMANAATRANVPIGSAQTPNVSDSPSEYP